MDLFNIAIHYLLFYDLSIYAYYAIILSIILIYGLIRC
jgi:hypothetical protein